MPRNLTKAQILWDTRDPGLVRAEKGHISCAAVGREPQNVAKNYPILPLFTRKPRSLGVRGGRINPREACEGGDEAFQFLGADLLRVGMESWGEKGTYSNSGAIHAQGDRANGLENA